jgi:predicted component of type VI protein secretion system
MILELLHKDPKKSIKLQQFPVIIGQGKNDDVVSLNDSSIGHYQCMIDTHNDGFMVWDLGTKLGTTINGVSIKENMSLRHNDEIIIGNDNFTALIGTAQ